MVTIQNICNKITVSNKVTMINMIWVWIPNRKMSLSAKRGVQVSLSWATISNKKLTIQFYWKFTVAYLDYCALLTEKWSQSEHFSFFCILFSKHFPLLTTLTHWTSCVCQKFSCTLFSRCICNTGKRTFASQTCLLNLNLCLCCVFHFSIGRSGRNRR